jgi:hypothetical protein
VNFIIYGTTSLASSVPRIVDGSTVFVTQIGADYYCINLFQYVTECV